MARWTRRSKTGEAEGVARARKGVKLPRRPKKQKSGLQWETCLEADDIEKLLAEDLPHPGVRTALEIRLQAAQSAASKIDRMLRDPLRGRARAQPLQDLRRRHRTMVRRGLSTAEPETAGAAADRRSHRRSDRNGAGGRLRRNQGALRRRAGSDRGPVPQHADPGAGASFHHRRFQRGRGARAGLPGRRRGQARELSASSISASGGTSTASRPSKSSALPTCRTSRRSGQLGKVFELGLGYSMGADKLLATIRKANIPNTEWITIAKTTRWVQKWRAQNPVDRRLLGGARRCGDGGGAQPGHRLSPAALFRSACARAFCSRVSRPDASSAIQRR